MPQKHPCWVINCCTLMEFRIMEKKLTFFHHLLTLPKSSLAAEIFTTQLEHNLPGLGEEVEKMIENFHLPPVSEIKKMKRTTWKKIVKKKIKEENNKEILKIMEKSKKLENSDLLMEPVERKDYLKKLTLL